MTPGPNKEPISPSYRDKWSSEHYKQVWIFTKAAVLSQKRGNESGDRLYTLYKMQEMPTHIKRGETHISHFVTPDCTRVCVQVTGWQVAHLWSWNWHIWKMGQTHGHLKGALSAERKNEDITNIEKKWIRVLAKSDPSFGEKEPSQHECQPEGEALAWIWAGGSGPLAGWGRVSWQK